MARPPSATAALLLLLISLLTVVAHCRPIEAQSSTEDDENGPPNPTLPAELDAFPAERRQWHGFLRLPSHRIRHHWPCRHGPFHLPLPWWAARHHGAFVFGDAPMRRFHFHHRHGEALSHLPAALPLPADDANREAGAEEVKAVAEPDPDRSLHDGEPKAFADADGAAHEAELAHDHEDDCAAVRAWKKEMLRRWFHFHHRHGMRLHRHHHDEQEEEAEPEGLKRFHHHHHDEDEEKDTMMRKQFLHAEHDDSDSDDEDAEVEEMVRRFRKAIMRRRPFGHGRRFHHHHRHGYGHYRHAEDAQEEGGVVAWIKGLVNRF